MKLTEKIESLTNKDFKKLIYLMSLFILVIVVLFIIINSMFVDLKLGVLLIFDVLISIPIISMILFFRIREYSEKSSTFKDKDKYFLKKEYELITDLIKEGYTISLRLVYLFIFSHVAIFLFFFNHLNDSKEIVEKVDSVIHNQLFIGSIMMLWTGYILAGYMFIFYEKINLFYLKKLMDI